LDSLHNAQIQNAAGRYAEEAPKNASSEKLNPVKNRRLAAHFKHPIQVQSASALILSSLLFVPGGVAVATKGDKRSLETVRQDRPRD